MIRLGLCKLCMSKGGYLSVRACQCQLCVGLGSVSKTSCLLMATEREWAVSSPHLCLEGEPGPQIRTIASKICRLLSFRDT